jgi:hypothetical protein
LLVEAGPRSGASSSAASAGRRYTSIHEIVHPEETPTMSAEMDEWKVRQERRAAGVVCAACRHASPIFKVNEKDHVHCQHVNATAVSSSAWDTLREANESCVVFTSKSRIG